MSPPCQAANFKSKTAHWAVFCHLSPVHATLSIVECFPDWIEVLSWLQVFELCLDNSER